MVPLKNKALRRYKIIWLRAHNKAVRRNGTILLAHIRNLLVPMYMPTDWYHKDNNPIVHYLSDMEKNPYTCEIGTVYGYDPPLTCPLPKILFPWTYPNYWYQLLAGVAQAAAKAVKAVFQKLGCRRLGSIGLRPLERTPR